LAAQLSPQQRRWRAQRGALARHHPEEFEVLKTHELARRKINEEEQFACEIVDRVLEEDWRNLSNYAELTPRYCRTMGVIPFVKPDDQTLYYYHPSRLTPQLREGIQNNRDELVEMLARRLRRAYKDKFHENYKAAPASAP
jgi:hypothetical protein